MLVENIRISLSKFSAMGKTSNIPWIFDEDMCYMLKILGMFEFSPSTESLFKYILVRDFVILFLTKYP